MGFKMNKPTSLDNLQKITDMTIHMGGTNVRQNIKRRLLDYKNQLEIQGKNEIEVGLLLVSELKKLKEEYFVD